MFHSKQTKIQLSQQSAIKLSSISVKSVHYIISMNNELNKQSFLNNDEGLDFGQIFRMFLMQSKLIALIVFLFTSMGAYFYLSTEKIYSLKSLIQIYPTQNSLNNSQLDLLISPNNLIFQVLKTYKSRTNMIDVTIANNLHVDFEELNEDRSSIINYIEDLKNTDYFQIEILFSDNSYRIKSNGGQASTVKNEECLVMKI